MFALIYEINTYFGGTQRFHILLVKCFGFNKKGSELCFVFTQSLFEGTQCVYM